MKIRGPFTRIIRIVSREDGFALVLALGISVVLGIMGTTVMLYSSSNSSLSSRSSFDAKAFTLAEAGVNDAVSILQNPSNDAQSTGLLCSDGAPLPCDLTHAKVATYDDGVVKYWGNYDTSSSTWTINSYGYMRNPTGPNVGKLSCSRRTRWHGTTSSLRARGPPAAATSR